MLERYVQMINNNKDKNGGLTKMQVATGVAICRMSLNRQLNNGQRW